MQGGRVVPYIEGINLRILIATKALNVIKKSFLEYEEKHLKSGWELCPQSLRASLQKEDNKEVTDFFRLLGYMNEITDNKFARKYTWEDYVNADTVLLWLDSNDIEMAMVTGLAPGGEFPYIMELLDERGRLCLPTVIRGFFFNPIQYIGFSKAHYFCYSSCAYPRVINSHCFFSHFFGYRTCLSIKRVFVFAVIAKTSLCSGKIESRICLILRFSTLWTSAVWVFLCSSHGLIISSQTLL